MTTSTRSLFYRLCLLAVISAAVLVLWVTIVRQSGTNEGRVFTEVRQEHTPSITLSFSGSQSPPKLASVVENSDNNGSSSNTDATHPILDVVEPKFEPVQPQEPELNPDPSYIDLPTRLPTTQPTTPPSPSPSPEPEDDSSRIWWRPPKPITHYGIKDWSKPNEGAFWKEGFCKEFLGKTFDRTSKVCSNRIICNGTQHNKRIGICTITDLAVRPNNLKKLFELRKASFTKCAALVNGDDACLPNPYLGDISRYMENVDPFHILVKDITKKGSLEGQCQVWVKGVSFFYMGVGDHIYFKMLGWYNLHRSLIQFDQNSKHNLTSFVIVRLPESNSPFKFLEFEQSLFPQSFGIDEFKEDIVCFEKVVLVPWTFAATPFRCKMDGPDLKRKCMGCPGNGIETDLRSFRRRVLSSCSLDDSKPINGGKRTFLVIQRKQYIRRRGDAHGKFQRVWTNSKELLAKMKTAFPNDEVIGIYGEDLEICAQVRHAHNANVLVGMHGAGMVHLWWLRNTAVSFEIVPPSQRGNGAFSTLSTLLGKRHHQLFNMVKERGAVVTVDNDKLIQEIKSKLS